MSLEDAEKPEDNNDENDRSATDTSAAHSYLLKFSDSDSEITAAYESMDALHVPTGNSRVAARSLEGIRSAE